MAKTIPAAGGPAPSWLSPAFRVGLLSLALSACAALLYFGTLTSVDGRTAFQIPVVVLAAAFGASELFVVHLQFGRQAHSISLSEIPLVLGLLFVTPGELIAAHVVGAVVVLLFVVRQPLHKIFFNASLFALGASGAAVVFHWLAAGASPTEPRLWLGATAAALLVDVLGGIVVTTVIYLHERVLHRDVMRDALTTGALAALFNTVFALIGALALWATAGAGLLLLMLGVFFLIIYRAYSGLAQRHAHLELLWEFSGDLGRTADGPAVIEAIATRTRHILRAELAEVVINSASGDERLCVAVDESGRIDVGHAIEPGDALAVLLAGGQSIVMPRGSKDIAVQHYLRSRALRDAIICPIARDGATIGRIVVCNRLGDTGTFDSDHQRLLEMLANHAAVTIDRSQLVHSLQREAAHNEYQARHDSLTGLLNRTRFTTLLDEALTEGGASGAVLLMDLDYFKEINDTLGHHTGDEVLVEVAARLHSCLREETAVARLGGDEFAILVPHVDAHGAGLVAERINNALRNQLNVAGMSLELGCSLGIALYPSHGTDAATLLQRADVAMYLAKEERGAYALYSEERDRYTSDRLTLIGELRTAIAQRELAVWYQPKVDLVDDQVVGAEALVRWEHPRRGMVQPDEFIGLAEHTGLIGPLTELVLDVGLQDCRRWRAKGWRDFTVSVNLSARSLLDAQLPETVEQLLGRHGLPAGCLILEITESSIMSDPQRASAILRRLDAMGVQLSIDDFGTGYSSFAYLRDLPISEIKIDRSFVLSMTREESDALIVRSIIDLGRNLQLRIVAEGVEDEPTRRTLAGLGCRLGQGYLMSPPKPAPRLTQWLQSQGDSLMNVVELPTGS